MILILIAGVGGSGKTTCMQQLSELLPNSASFCVDEYKELLYNCVGFNNSDEKKRLDEIAFDLVYHTIRNIEDHDYILIDYPYSSTRIDKLNEFIETLSGCTVITVRTKGNLELFYQRYRGRIQSPYRHKGHSSNRFPCGLDDLIEKTWEEYLNEIETKGMNSFAYRKLLLIDTDSQDSYACRLSEIAREIINYRSQPNSTALDFNDS